MSKHRRKHKRKSISLMTNSNLNSSGPLRIKLNSATGY